MSPQFNDLLPRPSIDKKNRRRAKRGKPLLPTGLPKSQWPPRSQWAKPGDIKGGRLKGGLGTGPAGSNPKKGGGPGKGGGGSNKGGKKKPPFDLTAPLDRKTFNREMRAAERLQFRPLQRQLNREHSAQKFRAYDENDAWYKAYQADIAALRGQAAGVTGGILDRVQAAQTAAGDQDASNRNAMMERLARDAQLRGAVLDPNVELGQVNAEAARANAAMTMLGTLGGQGANQQNYLINRQMIAGQAQREARDRELARLRGIDEDKRALARERGDFRTDFRRTAREDERKYALENRALGAKKGYNKALAATANKHVTVDNNYHGLPKGGGGSNGGGYSVREAIGLARQQARKKANFPKSKAHLVDYLINRGVDAKTARKAANRMFGGRSPKKAPPYPNPSGGFGGQTTG